MTDKLIYIFLLSFIMLDLLTGFVQALMNNEFKSSVMRMGIIHKASEIIIVALAHLCQASLPLVGIDVGNGLVNVCMAYLIIMELGSICENLLKINPGMGGIINKVFGDYTKENEHSE